MHRLRSFLVVPPLLALLSGSAGATPEYPGTVDRALSTSCPNPLSRCLICHTTALGGKTATQPFAMSLRDYGLSRGREPGELTSAIERLPDDTDSDADGTPDKEELFDCSNPSGEEFGIPPEYGCDGATLSPRAPDADPLSLIVAIVVGLGLVRLRRAPTPAPSPRA